MNIERIDKLNYYLSIASQVATRSTCLRRCFGAVIVKNDEIVSTGYNGAPRGRKNCSDCGYCIREQLNIPRGERYELCRSVHAEANAIISAKRSDMIDSCMYVSCIDPKSGDVIGDINSCSMCKRLIINAGIAVVCFNHPTPDKIKIELVKNWVENDESLTGKRGY